MLTPKQITASAGSARRIANEKTQAELAHLAHQILIDPLVRLAANRRQSPLAYLPDHSHHQAFGIIYFNWNLGGNKFHAIWFVFGDCEIKPSVEFLWLSRLAIPPVLWLT